MKDKAYRSLTKSCSTGCGNMFLTFALNEDHSIHKVFAEGGKNGTCTKALLSVISELASHILTLPKSQRTKVFSKACGHLCHYGQDCCGNIMMRELMDLELTLKEVFDDATNPEKT